MWTLIGSGAHWRVWCPMLYPRAAFTHRLSLDDTRAIMPPTPVADAPTLLEAWRTALDIWWEHGELADCGWWATRCMRLAIEHADAVTR